MTTGVSILDRVDQMRDVAVILPKRDLLHLVKVALQHREISIGRAAELLGLPVSDLDCLIGHWGVEGWAEPGEEF